MAYYSYIVDRALVRARYRCEACGKHWSDFPKVMGDAPIDLHSADTFHLLMQKNGFYKVTSPPKGHEQMKGRLLRPEMFQVYTVMNKRPDDAFCLCARCHITVHDMAEVMSKDILGDDKDRKNAIPSVLEYVTIMYVLSGGKWAP